MTDLANRSVDEHDVRLLLSNQAQAWNEHDAEAFGACFAEDARYIAFFGGIYRGKREIVESHRALWAGALAGTNMYLEIVEIRFVAPTVAVAVTRGDVAKRTPSRAAKVQSWVIVREAGGSWRIAQFQNTKRSRFFQFLTYRSSPAAIPSLDRAT